MHERERVRLFVALELPPEVRRVLAAWRERINPTIARLRLIDPADLHATLCFLGWAPREDVAPILEACRVAERLEVEEVGLGRALWLPRGRPRVLAVSLEDPAGGLARLQSALSRALAAGGWYQPETRPYLGHVTVARVGRGVRVERGRPVEAPIPGDPFGAERVTLYRSHVSSVGARYESLGSVSVGERRD